MTTVDWVTAVVAVIALGVAIASAKFTRDQRDSSRRQVTAAENAVASANRQAGAAEKQLAILFAEREESLASRARAPRWTIEYHSGDLYVVTNKSDATAFNVE